MPLFLPVSRSVSATISFRTSSKSVYFFPFWCRNSAHSAECERERVHPGGGASSLPTYIASKGDEYLIQITHLFLVYIPVSSPNFLVPIPIPSCLIPMPSRLRHFRRSGSEAIASTPCPYTQLILSLPTPVTSYVL